jgi:hypothetical protein
VQRALDFDARIARKRRDRHRRARRYGSVKYFAMSSLTFAKFAKSVRKMVTFTTCRNVPPEAAITALMFSKTRVASFSKSPSTICMGTGSSGIWPAMYSRVADAHSL